MKRLEKYKSVSQKYYGLFYHLNSFLPNYFDGYHAIPLHLKLNSIRTDRIQFSKHDFNYTGVVTLIPSLESLLDNFEPYLIRSTNSIAICEYEVDDNCSIDFSSFKVNVFNRGTSRWDIIKTVRGEKI